MAVNTEEEKKENEEAEKGDKVEGENIEEKNKEEEKSGGGESSALQQAERAKAAVILGKQKLFGEGVIDPIVSCLLSVEIANFENLIC